MADILHGALAARERMIERTIRKTADSPDYYSADEARLNMIKRIYRLDDDDIDWITSKGTHVPIDDDGTAIGGPLKGKKFVYAKSDKNELTVNPDKAKNKTSEQSNKTKAKSLTLGNNSAKIKVSLTKQDFARFYAALGDVKKGGHVTKAGDGDIFIPLYSMSDGDTPKLIKSTNSYIKPHINAVFTFKTDDEMSDALEMYEKWL